METYTNIKNVIVAENDVESHLCNNLEVAINLAKTFKNGVVKVCEVGFLNDGDWDILKDIAIIRSK